MTTLGPLVHRTARAGGAVLVLGVLQFIAGMVIAQLGYPGYSLIGNYISDLGGPHSPLAWVFNDSIRVLGLLGILGVVMIRTAFQDRLTSKVGLWFLVVAEFGAILVGTFPETSPELGGNIHSVVSAITFIGSGIALLILSVAMLRDTRWEGYRGYTFLSGVVTLIALVLFQENLNGPLGVGGMERLIVAPILLWAILIGIHLLRMPTYAPAKAAIAPGSG